VPPVSPRGHGKITLPANVCPFVRVLLGRSKIEHVGYDHGFSLLSNCKRAAVSDASIRLVLYVD
jgi:hypothetical protein